MCACKARFTLAAIALQWSVTCLLAQGQGCAAQVRLVAAFTERGPGSPPDAATARSLVQIAEEGASDPACVENRVTILGLGVDAALLASDWDRAARWTGELLELPAPSAAAGDAAGSMRAAWAQNRLAWYRSRVQAQFARVELGQLLPQEAAQTADAFVAAIGAERRAGRRAGPWVVSGLSSIIKKAEVLRRSGDRESAANAEQQGALWALSLRAEPGWPADLAAGRPEEFLQRASLDLALLGRSQDAAAILSGIDLDPGRVRPAAAHARVLAVPLAREGRLVPFASACCEVLPRDEEALLFARDLAVLAWPSSDAALGRILDGALGAGAPALALAEQLRDARPGAQGLGPLAGELLAHRAVVAARRGDLATADRCIVELRQRGIDGEWARGLLATVELERAKSRSVSVSRRRRPGGTLPHGHSPRPRPA